MFDLSWAHMGIIVLVALLALGPKELPNALRTITMLMRNARKLASEFQSGVNEIIREADLEDARKKLTEIQTLNKNQIQDVIEKAVDPAGEMKSALAIDPDKAAETPAPVPLPASDTAPAESQIAPAPASETAMPQEAEEVPPAEVATAGKR
ncbi:MAG TPA: Sec-independent protein translocase protein TatB [Candidatus Cybelea sp.]|nr:Sec-independent protein translocase protein TatB [Candidatus Cybelea sp.]